MAAVARYPNCNIAVRQGARIIKRHDGGPKPEPPARPRNPNLKSWSAHLIGGKKMQLLGYIDAASEAAAIEPPSRYSAERSEAQAPGLNLRGKAD